jgi:hypothetical protein
VRGVREETRVSEGLARACEKWPRAEQAWEAITWALARDPEVGRPLSESGDLRNVVWRGARSIGMPDIGVTYRISAENIEILDAEFADAEAGQAGSA